MSVGGDLRRPDLLGVLWQVTVSEFEWHTELRSCFRPRSRREKLEKRRVFDV